MAHQVETMMFHGQVPWHGLGTYLSAPPTIGEGICAAGLDWSVALEPLSTDDGRGVGHFATVRESDGRILGFVGPNYRVLQNIEAFQWFQPYLDAGELELHTAGSLQGGRKVWVLARLLRSGMEIAEGDIVKKYLLLSNSHDGSQAVRIGLTPIRVVCANTLSLAHGHDGSHLRRVTHTNSIRVTLAHLRAQVERADDCFEASAQQYRLLARIPISHDDLRHYVRAVFGVEAVGDVSPRRAKMFAAIEEYFDRGWGMDRPSGRGTCWTAYNAVNEYLAHQRGRTRDCRLRSLWFGEAARLDRRALELALAMAA